MAFDRMVNGFRVFKANYISGNDSDMFDKLVNEGQSPETLVIACSDSRIDPALITNSQPGDIFSVRNVAAMVPPYSDAQDGALHGTSAAIEYAVSALKVKYIVVIGHALCGGIKALAESKPELDRDVISRWIGISVEARDAVRKFFPQMSVVEQSKLLEQASLLVSMKNLMTFPSVKARVEAGELQVHGWYFDMPNGKLLNYDPTMMKFRNVLAGHTAPAICTETCGCETSMLSMENFMQVAKDSQTIVDEKAKRSKKPQSLKDAMRKAGYGAAVAGGAIAGASAEEVIAAVAALL